MQYDTDAQIAQESSEVSQELACALSTLLAPLLVMLDAQLDVRLVRTFLATIAVMIQFGNRAQGLLLSSIGGLSPLCAACAGWNKAHEPPCCSARASGAVS